MALLGFVSTSLLSAKLHYTDTGYGHVVQHHSTNGQAHNNSTTCCTTNLPHRNARAQHLDMSRCGKFLSVDGEFIVEFGTNVGRENGSVAVYLCIKLIA